MESVIKIGSRVYCLNNWDDIKKLMKIEKHRVAEHGIVRDLNIVDEGDKISFIYNTLDIYKDEIINHTETYNKSDYLG